MRSSVAVLAVLMSLLAAANATQAQDAALVRQIKDAAGAGAGLCVHLGCGSAQRPALAAELAAGSRLLVHGLAADEASLERARRAAESKQVLGQLVVEKLALNPLPHVRDVANLVVVEDPDALAAAGLKMQEVERITRPGGAIVVVRAGQVTKTVKPWPKEMDDWPHPAHGPDGNMVSADRLIRFPLGLRWLDGVPLNFNLWAACRGWVIADGRVFTLSTTELENLGPACFAQHKQDQYLTARDAFNGLPLWKVNCQTPDDGKALNKLNTSALVTDGKRVYAYQRDRLVGLDAATGQVAQSYAVKHPPARLLLADGILVASGWQGKEEAVKGDSGRDPLWSYWVNKSGQGAVEAFDARQGTRKWSVPLPAMEILAADGLAYLLIQTGNPASGQEIRAVELATGRQRWQVAHARIGARPNLHLSCAGRGVLVVARPWDKALSILSAADGRQLWEIGNTGAFWTPLVAGLLWHTNKKYDPTTGKVVGILPASIEPHVCTPSAVVGNLITATRGSDFVELASDAAGKPGRATRIRYAATRGACIEGATPANGMFYTGQNNCRCAPGQVPGFVAFGPAGELPTAADFGEPRPIEKGPAFGSAGADLSSTDDWPMFRHDAQRSGAAPMRLAAHLKLRWQSPVARPAEGPLGDAWKARLTSCLTAPVVAEEKVFAAAADAGQVVALDAQTGRPAWRATLGGRIDTPPTIHRGLCLVGSHDGWIYALRARDGQLAWRTRIAPWERRMVAFGQVESVWPAFGSVLVHDGVAYATAGRTTESDGGIAVTAFDPATARQVWARQLGPGAVRVNDLLVLRGGKLAVHHIELDLRTGRGEVVPVKGRYNGTLEGLIDGSWTRLGTRRSGNLQIGRATAEMFVCSAATVFGYQSASRSCYALARAKTGGTEKLAPADYAWRLPLPANYQAEALALAENALVLAGRVCDPHSAVPGGFLWTVSLDAGKPILKQTLPCAPTYDGLALAHGRLYVALENGQLACFEPVKE